MPIKLTPTEYIERSEKLKQYIIDKFNNIIVPENFSQKRGIDKIELECKIHGKFLIETRYITKSKYCCQKCANLEKTKNAVLSTKKPQDKFIDQITDIHSEYDLSHVVYNGWGEKIHVVCKKHGDFFPLAGNFLSKGTGCPSCGHKISKPHQKILDFLRSINVNVTVNDKSLIQNMEIDAYSDIHKIGIEINGLYWHSFLPQSYHVEKMNKCNDKGIHLIQIYDHEINNNFDVIKSRLKGYFGKNRTIYAKTTTFKEITPKESNIFIKENHLQGYVNCKFNYGLYDETSNLVAVMTFNTPRFNKQHKYELVRYASLKGINVVGGASKLLSNFIKIIGSNSIISYADLRFTDIKRNVYLKLGFKILNTTTPNYIYFKNNLILKRYECQKHKLKRMLKQFDPDKTEYENMILNGFRRVYDCGNVVFSLKI